MSVRIAADELVTASNASAHTNGLCRHLMVRRWMPRRRFAQLATNLLQNIHHRRKLEIRPAGL